jgi:hypothetical protein
MAMLLTYRRMRYWEHRARVWQQRLKAQRDVLRTLIRHGADRGLDAASRRAIHAAGRAHDARRRPNANAYAERFVRSINEECLDRLIPLGERHWRRAVAEYVAHYHHERNHQGIANALIVAAQATSTVGPIRRRPRLGGVLNYYERAA